MFESLEDRRLMSVTALASPATFAYAEQDTVQASQRVGPAMTDGTDDTASRGFPEVPGYEILEELGRGGMSVVDKARHAKLNRTVALKMVLTGAHAGPKEIARFLLEAEVAARIQHPNILQIYELGEHGGLPDIAMEYVEGGTLSLGVREPSAGYHSTAGLFETLSRAVYAAHERGVVHRDLKPSNVLLTADGLVKITDFGLAKRLEAAASEPRKGLLLTESGEVMGTPAYMAPEQAGGRVREIGPAMDIHALGVMLYQALCGQLPFSAPTHAETFRLILEAPPVSPAALRPGVLRDLETPHGWV